MLWNNEKVKLVFTFDNNEVYEICTGADNDTDNFIVTFIPNDIVQTNYTNLFGSVSSNSISVTVYDTKNNLDMNNSKSPYYNYMRNGVKIEAFISYDNVNYEPYGTYYVTDWGNMFSTGTHDVVTIVAHDELHYIINNDIPKLSAYSGVRCDELIRKVLEGCGVADNRIIISEQLDLKLKFGVSEDSKVGYFLNDICQALCAVIVINKKNEILVVPALSGFGKEYVLSDEPIESVSSSNNSNSIYTNVKCTYDKKTGSLYGGLILSNSNIEAGKYKINNMLFSRKALNVSEISIESDCIHDGIDIKGFSAYQNGIDIEIDNGNSEIEEAYINITGAYIKTNKKNVYSDISFSDIKGNRRVSYEMFNEYVQTSNEAQDVANQMARYIELMNNKIVIRSLYNPKITVGDILIFNNKLLSGKYLVIASETIFGINYEKILNVIPFKLGTIWDDSLSWNDEGNWQENMNISLN